MEICRDGSWGAICGNTNSWGTKEARVVCKQLGLPYTGRVKSISSIATMFLIFLAAQAQYFGPGPDPVHYSNFVCKGNEVSLTGCNRDMTPNCTNHTQDVGVMCLESCTNGTLRVAGGDTPNMGRVEVCYNGEWGTICDKGWDTNDVKVACYQLGFEHNSSMS